MSLGDRARELRRNQTDAERKLWTVLRAGRFGGFKFRRQHPVGPYIVDFICVRAELVIEVDGDQHAEQVAYDRERELWLEGQNLRVLRFSNRDVLVGLPGVERAIWQELTSLLPHPSLAEERADEGSPRLVGRERKG